MQKADADRERRSNSASEADASPDTKTTKDTTRVPLPPKGGQPACAPKETAAREGGSKGVQLQGERIQRYLLPRV